MATRSAKTDVTAEAVTAEHTETLMVINPDDTSSVEQEYNVRGAKSGANRVELPKLPRHADPDTLQVYMSRSADGTVTSWSHGRMVSDAELDVKGRLAKIASGEDYLKMLKMVADEFSGANVTVTKLRGKYKDKVDKYSGKLVSTDAVSIVLLNDLTNEITVLPVADIVAVDVALGTDVGKLVCSVVPASRVQDTVLPVIVSYSVGKIDFAFWYKAVIINPDAHTMATDGHVMHLSGVSQITNNSGGSYENVEVDAVFKEKKEVVPRVFYKAREKGAPRSVPMYQQQQTMAFPGSMAEGTFGSGDTLKLSLGENIALDDGHTTGTLAFSAMFPVKKFYQFDGQRNADAKIVVVWRNTEDTGIGRALPAAKLHASERTKIPTAETRALKTADSKLCELEIDEIIEKNDLVEWELGTTDKVTIEFKRNSTFVSMPIGRGADRFVKYDALAYDLRVFNKLPSNITARIVINIGHETWEIGKGSGKNWSEWGESVPKWKRPEKKRERDQENLSTVVFDCKVDRGMDKGLEFTIVDKSRAIKH